VVQVWLVVVDSVAVVLPAHQHQRLNLKAGPRWQTSEMPERVSKKDCLFSLGPQTL
jgi:hypothetical protein